MLAHTRHFIAPKVSLKDWLQVKSVFFFSSSWRGAVKEEREGMNGDS